MTNEPGYRYRFPCPICHRTPHRVRICRVVSNRRHDAFEFQTEDTYAEHHLERRQPPCSRLLLAVFAQEGAG